MTAPRLLIVSDNADDIRLVRGLLAEEFSSADIFSANTRTVPDFGRIRPAVILFAFDSLANAQAQCRELAQARELAAVPPPRTIVLCTRDELRESYALCRRGEFDDYVLFWPLNHDAPRLLMAVHQALQLFAAGDTRAVTLNDLAAQARQFADVGDAVDALAHVGDEAMARASRSLCEAETSLKDALRQIATPADAGNVAPLAQESLQARLELLRRDTVAPRVSEARQYLQEARRSLRVWQTGLAPQSAASRKLQALLERVRPSVVIVDDDEMQCRLVVQALADTRIVCRAATSAVEALQLLRRGRPDLILMDIDLAETDGIELIGRIRRLPGYADVPIVMVTGHSDRAAVMSSVSAGAAGFLVKPLIRNMLYAQVNAVLGWPAARLETVEKQGRAAA